MIIRECKSYDSNCPCLYCSKLIDCGPCATENGLDTETLCDVAREYCEKVNGDGREENISSL